MRLERHTLTEQAEKIETWAALFERIGPHLFGPLTIVLGILGISIPNWENLITDAPIQIKIYYGLIIIGVIASTGLVVKPMIGFIKEKVGKFVAVIFALAVLSIFAFTLPAAIRNTRKSDVVFDCRQLTQIGLNNNTENAIVLVGEFMNRGRPTKITFDKITITTADGSVLPGIYEVFSHKMMLTNSISRNILPLEPSATLIVQLKNLLATGDSVNGYLALTCVPMKDGKDVDEGTSN